MRKISFNILPVAFFVFIFSCKVQQQTTLKETRSLTANNYSRDPVTIYFYLKNANDTSYIRLGGINDTASKNRKNHETAKMCCSLSCDFSEVTHIKVEFYHFGELCDVVEYTKKELLVDLHGTLTINRRGRLVGGHGKCGNYLKKNNFR